MGALNFKGKPLLKITACLIQKLLTPKAERISKEWKKGLAPIGHDGKSVNVHHIDQTNTGPLLEMSQTNHQQPGLHQITGQSPSQIVRNAFNQWRTDYWKWRANDFK